MPSLHRGLHAFGFLGLTSPPVYRTTNMDAPTSFIFMAILAILNLIAIPCAGEVYDGAESRWPRWPPIRRKKSNVFSTGTPNRFFLTLQGHPYPGTRRVLAGASVLDLLRPCTYPGEPLAVRSPCRCPTPLAITAVAWRSGVRLCRRAT